MMLFLFLVLHIHGIMASIQQEVKIWTPNTNYDNPRNWGNGRIPCSKDRIIFPTIGGVVTMLPKSVSFSEMVLPKNGELILPKDVNFFDGSAVEDSCKGQDAWFMIITDTWHDPANWNISSANAFPRSGSRRNRAVPEAFAIPCPADEVRFPEGATFKVEMSSDPLNIATLSINGLSYNNEEMQSLLESRTGKLLFSGNPHITVTGNACTDPTGCVCGNEDPKILKKICSHVKCLPVSCSNPIKAIGQCCSFCGAYFQAEYNSGFNLNQFTAFLESQLEKGNYFSLESYTSKTRQNNIQTVFVDAEDDISLAENAAKNILDEMIHDNIIDQFDSWQLVVSGPKENVPGTALHSSQGLSSGSVATIIIIIILIGAAAAAWYIYKKRHIPGFSFARFDLRSSKLELELGTTPHEELAPEEPTTEAGGSAFSKAFDNPVYDTVKDVKEEPLIEDQEEEENVVENPMFMVFDSAQAD